MYGKLFTSMYDGSLCTVGPWEALITFQQLVILADKNGVVDMTADAIARRTTIPLDVIQKGLAALQEADPQSRTPDEDGRRILLLSSERDWGWKIVNYQHYRSIRTADDRREYLRQYQQIYRAKRKQNVNMSTARKQCQPKKPIAEAEAEVEVYNSEKETHHKNLNGHGGPQNGVKRPDSVSPQTWEDFLALRKGKKSPFTQTALNRMLVEVEKSGKTLEEALQICCERGWQGFKAEWVHKEEYYA